MPARGRGGLPRAGRVHGRGGRRARAGDRPRRRRLRRRRRRLGRRATGRWIHYGLTSSDVLDTALALQLRRGGRDRPRRRARLPRRAGRARAGARATRSASAAPTASTPSRPPSACASPASPSRPTATSTGSHAAFEQPAVGKLSGAVGTYASVPPAVEARVMERLGLRREDVATQVVPRDRHAALLVGDRARRRRPRALRDRGPQPAADRGARGRGAVRRRPEGLLGDAAQAQPDPHRADHRARAGPARLRAGRPRERRALARARHLPLRRRAGHPPRRDDRCSTTCSTWRPRSRAG